MVDNFSNKFELYTLESPKLGEKQVEKTYEIIESINKQHWDIITNIRKTTQDDENRRKIGNDKRMQERLDMIQKQEEKFPDEQFQIETKIKELMLIEQCDELETQFNQLKSLCESVIQHKNDIINDFLKELNYKDQRYVDSLKKFRNHIELMVELMRKQFKDLRNEMFTHLDIVEDEYLKDRDKLIKDYRKNIENLIRNLDFVENSNEGTLTKLEDDKELESEQEVYQKEMGYINKVLIMEKYYNFLKENIEDFNYELKILLEKLEFRVEVREEKIKENKEKKIQYQRWHDKLKEQLNKHIKAYHIMNNKLKIKNNQLKDDFKKMTNSYNELKKKFHHFEIYDDLRFKSIFQMKSIEAKELALKVALADRTIKSQQLGIENIVNDNNEGFSLEELQRDQDLEEGNTSNDDIQANGKEEEKFRESILSRISTERVRQVFNCIMQEAEFLIELDVIELCKDLSEEERLPHYIESICKALGIKTEAELNQLLNIFEKHNLNNSPNNEDIRTSEADDDSNSNLNKDDNVDTNKIIIDPDFVLKYLEEFFLEKKKKAKEQMIGNVISHAFTGEENEEAKKERMRYLSEIYWTKLGNIISDKTYNVWLALDKGLTKYHDILFERKQLLEETRALYDKNKELKQLMKNYLNNEKNRQLLVPPYQTIKVEDMNFGMSDLID